MFAVIAHGGKQYRVAPGDRIRLERVSGAAGDTVEFTELRLVESEGDLRTAASLAGAKVIGTVLEHGLGRKVLVFKKKRRKQYRRTRGHRQGYTEVRIDRIV